jgi:signal transduction histidine kinase/CheY-like chemotaxis protein
MKTDSTSKPAFWCVAPLIVLAALLQLFPVTLPGLQPLTLGLFVSMPVLLLFPMSWGLLAAIVPLGVTVFSLGHPFELVLGAMEALWLSFVLRRRRMSALVADLVFWSLVGSPLAVVFGVQVQALSSVVASFNAIMQCVSHMLAVAVADVLIQHTPLGSWLGGVKRAESRVRPLLFHLVLWPALLPLIAGGLAMASWLSSYVREQDRVVLSGAAARISQQVDQFFEHHQAVLEHMSGVIATGGTDVPRLIEIGRRVHPEFSAFFITSKAGETRHASPAGGATFAGIRSLAESEIFRAVRDSRGPFISGIVMPQTGASKPSLAIGAPLVGEGGEFQGTVQGWIDLSLFEQWVAVDIPKRGYELLLVARDGRVIVADATASARTGTRITYLPEAALVAAPDRVRVEFEKIGADGRLVPYVGYVVRSEFGGVTVIAQRPTTLAWKRLNWIALGFLAIVGIMVFAAAWAASAARRRLSEPLETFANAANRQAELKRVEPIYNLPTEAPFEVAMVYRAFNQLASELQATYRELRESNVILDQKVAERTRELEEARSLAESASRTKSEFLAMATHEIRTPLNVILGLATALQEGIRDPEARRRLDTIRGAGVRLLGLVNDVLDLSRIEAGRLELQLAPVELGGLLKEVDQMFRLGAEQQGLELRIENTAPCPLWFNGDSMRLLQILINLIANALKFTRRGSVTLRVDAMGTGDDVHLRFGVIDTGPGIAPEFRASLFQPYFQLPGERAGGSGLGLPISRRLVNLLGGELALRSEPGRGSHFHFTIRVARTPPPPESNERALARPADPAALRILAVDDNVANQEALRLMLEPVCQRLEIVSSAAEAMERLQRETFDVALIDLEMPVEDGYSVARATRQSVDPLNADCLLVAISAYSQVDVWPRCAASGFDAFVGKPIVRSQLLELVASARRVAHG